MECKAGSIISTNLKVRALVEDIRQEMKPLIPVGVKSPVIKSPQIMFREPAAAKEENKPAKNRVLS